tara:strand:- start:212 stop:1303 length:1092 start_codon:yes stop_codon:yes gene_type:complete
MIINLIIARYNENLDWLKNVPENINIIIYNKGKNDINYPFISLPNIGRESHTYLYYIINNYDKLGDINIFCQGNPFEHNPNFLKYLLKVNEFEPIQPLTYYYDTNLPNKVYRDRYFKTNKTNLFVTYVNNDFVVRYPFFIYNSFNIKFFNNIKKILNVNNLLDYYKKKFNLTNIDLNNLMPYSYSAIFSVNKKIIKERSLNFYKVILNELVNTTKFDLGYILERLWLSIFFYDKYNKKYKKLLLVDYKIIDHEYEIYNNSIKLKTNFFYNVYFTIILDDNQEFKLNIFTDHISIIYSKKKKKVFFKNKISDSLLLDIKLVGETLTIKCSSNKIEYFINSKSINKLIYHQNFSYTKKEDYLIKQ